MHITHFTNGGEKTYLLNGNRGCSYGWNYRGMGPSHYAANHLEQPVDRFEESIVPHLDGHADRKAYLDISWAEWNVPER